MNADAIAVLRMLRCCAGSAKTVVIAWGGSSAEEERVRKIMERLERRGFLSRSCYGHYRMTAVGMIAIAQDDRMGFDEITQETAENYSKEHEHATR